MQVYRKDNMYIKKVGSICSGIEAASIAWKCIGFNFLWFSEIADFPSALLSKRYPKIPNLGDMNLIPEKILTGQIEIPDLICGGTPCQAFSLAGWKKGLNDDRGNLSLKFVDIVNANDIVREKTGKQPSVIFWENVEGVLTDKTNAFGCLISSLAGLDNAISMKRWPSAGLLRGPKRNIAWRVLDAKFFGIPQQRRRLYVVAGGKDFYPENILFEKHNGNFQNYPKQSLIFEKEGSEIEIFREYTDCLYSAYGTKWNGNAAAYNGSLYIVQNHRIRRLSAIECERLMGFPDNYTNIENAKKTNRYQALGNSWAVPVIKWIGQRIANYTKDTLFLVKTDFSIDNLPNNVEFFNFNDDLMYMSNGTILNCSSVPENCAFGSMKDIVCSDAPEDIYISPVGCYGIYRRKQERKIKINARLEQILLETSSLMDLADIEKRSKIQKRGAYSGTSKQQSNPQFCLFAS